MGSPEYFSGSDCDKPRSSRGDPACIDSSDSEGDDQLRRLAPGCIEAAKRRSATDSATGAKKYRAAHARASICFRLHQCVQYCEAKSAWQSRQRASSPHSRQAKTDVETVSA